MVPDNTSCCLGQVFYSYAQSFILALILIIYPANLSAQQCIDIDGNVYQTIQIGNQLWMRDNLRTTRYKDGTSITYIPGSNQSIWSNTQSGAYAYYNDSFSNSSQYGILYNWFAVAAPAGICPQGWHAPSDTEWNTLMLSLGLTQSELNQCLHTTCGEIENVGGQLKSVTSLWDSPNSGANNSSGFTAVPGGRRNPSSQPVYYGLGIYGYYWTSTPSSPDFAYYRLLQSNNTGIYRGDLYGSKYRQTGMSCRCVYDSPVGINDEQTSPSQITVTNFGNRIVISSETESGNVIISEASGRIVAFYDLPIGVSNINLYFDSGIYCVIVRTNRTLSSHRFFIGSNDL